MRSLSGGSRNEKGLLARFQDRDPAQRLGSAFSHSEGLEKGSSDTCLTAFPRSDLQALCSQKPSSPPAGRTQGPEGANGLALLVALTGRVWVGDSRQQPFPSHGAILGSGQEGQRGALGSCSEGPLRQPQGWGPLPLLTPWAGFEFINKSKIQAALI